MATSTTTPSTSSSNSSSTIGSVRESIAFNPGTGTASTTSETDVSIPKVPSTPADSTVTLPGTSTSVVVGSPSGGIIHGDARNNVVIAQGGNTDLTGGIGHNVLVGGPGDNLFNSNGGVTTYIHHAGATDIITSFNPSGGDKISSSLTLTNSFEGTATSPDAGLTDSPALVLQFNDHSEIALVGIHSPVETTWFL